MEALDDVQLGEGSDSEAEASRHDDSVSDVYADDFESDERGDERGIDR